LKESLQKEAVMSKAIILAIDDTPSNLLTLGAALSGEFDVQIALSGSEGLALAKASPPDIILLDVMMPEMDGYEVCRRLKADPQLGIIPVVFISALDDKETEIRGLSLGAADFLTKPINVDIARLRIQNLLERERLRQEVKAQSDQLASQLASLRKLTTAVEQSPASIVITDLEASIEFVNPRFTEVTGYCADDVVGKNPRILQSGLTDKATFTGMWAKLTQGKPWTGELVNQRKNGDIYWEEAQIAPVKDADGKIGHYVAVKTDITERKALAAELEQYRHHLEALVESRTRDLSIAKENAEAASRAKTTFLANMSHELRTPLSGIIGMTGLALRRSTDDKQKDYLAKIDISAKNLLAIINDVLDISKIEAERLTLEKIDFQLADVLESIRSLLGPSAKQKGLDLRIEVPAEIAAATFCGDPLRLRQVLLNLASNAVKFTATGAVIVRVLRTDVLRFEVEDTGIGIAAADQARIFSAFEQADASLSRQFGGTGLGLAISKRLVELMGGKIGVNSIAGQGSTFWFAVGLDEAAPPSKPINES
jgi:PAS domain S-box-containing protein